ncbi:MAG: rhomboid family intramembrane serine protease [Halieaceae bacterium]|jgi:membrane associated rhomboid family serine protease|nr:rhomboid family intramembrane serine protease [Halieaceae bacterium]
MSTKTTPLKRSIVTAASFVILIWWLKVAESLLGLSLYPLGVLPRNSDGLVGILTGPLVHGSWQHLMGNTLPLLMLGSILIYGYPRSRWLALALIWLLSGTGVWLFGRDSYHLGASGLSHGMFFYLLVGGLLRRDRRSIALLMVAFFMYSSMLMTIFPSEPDVSFEYHLFGAMAGSWSAYIFRKWEPMPPPSLYPWQRRLKEEQAWEEDDPIIGDQWKSESQRANEQAQTRRVRAADQPVNPLQDAD